ncbi:hypothetical protein Plhal304r1_c039g0115971 [Plasmopara halstedii]
MTHSPILGQHAWWASCHHVVIFFHQMLEGFVGYCIAVSLIALSVLQVFLMTCSFGVGKNLSYPSNTNCSIWLTSPPYIPFHKFLGYSSSRSIRASAGGSEQALTTLLTNPQ